MARGASAPRFASVLASVCAVSWHSPIHGGCTRYAVETIPGPNCAFVASSSSGTGISATGEICGGWFDCNGGAHGGVWLGRGGWQTIPLPPGILGIGPADMNSARNIAADVAALPNPNLNQAAFVDFSSGSVTIIGGLPGSNISHAKGIAENNIVCGYSYNTSGPPPRQAFIWQNGQFTVLNLPFGTRSVANDIADNGSVCGWMGDGNFTTAHGFIWTPGQAVDTGAVLPDAMGVDLRGISNLNSVCGFSAYTHPDPRILYRFRACHWSDGQGTDLGTLPGFLHSRALDLNDSNVVIGYCDNFPLGGQLDTAFVWQSGIMRALDDLIPSTLNLHIGIVWAIKNAGQITGMADALDNSGDQIAVRLTPIPGAVGDFNCDDVVNIDDLLGIITNWGPAQPGTPSTFADLNENGVVNIDDLLMVLLNWD